MKANDGKYYRYNLEVDGIYYCENNIIIKDGIVITEYTINPERYILIDQYILDLKEKRIKLFNNSDNDDAFIKSINDVGKISKIDVIKNKERGTKTITIYYEDNKQVKIEINKENAIIGYENKYVEKIGNWFLSSNKQLSSISLPQVKTIGDHFLSYNNQLINISLPQVQTIGDYFLYYNEILTSISLPQVKSIKGRFLLFNCLL